MQVGAGESCVVGRRERQVDLHEAATDCAGIEGNDPDRRPAVSGRIKINGMAFQ